MSSTVAVLERELAAHPLIDTHEHLVEERTRRERAGRHVEVPCADAALLFWDYAGNDLAVAGMPPAELQRFFAPDVSPGRKWELVRPYWLRCRNTGVLRAIEVTVAELYDEPVLDAGAFERISARMAEPGPGFYRDVLGVAGVESCQVNSLEAIFCETEQPDLLFQDIGITWLAREPHLPGLARTTGIRASDLAGMHRVIDWFFDRYGTGAVAVKLLSAYSRRLDFRRVDAATAAPIFARYARDEPLDEDDATRLEDHLTLYCIARATEHGLPVKVHCGMYDGHDVMPLERVHHNAADLADLVRAHPDTSFVLLHMGYPYQHELLALAKHYSNVYVELSWTWIANPVATAGFVGEFVVTAPAGKLLAFGGDYRIVEPVVGHARLARHGLARALGRVVDEGWLTVDDAVGLVEPLARANALAAFPRLRAAGHILT
jgi:uncharacterized protein